MFRTTSRSLLRAAQSSLAPARTVPGRRFLATEPPRLKSRSWKSSAARWGIAIAGIYYYNTSPIFAEEPSNLLNPSLEALEDSRSSESLDVLTSPERRKRRAASTLESAVQSASEENVSTTEMHQSGIPRSGEMAESGTSGVADLEEEAEGEGAFNPETGEINWDCPCLGGMAHGPCGPEFREAFSCFVYSTEEPKGMDCIEKFQGMQECFRKYPEVYKGELEDDEENAEIIEAGLEEEREQLVKEIRERKEQQKASEVGQVKERRLLEEPAPAPKPAPKKAAARRPSESRPASKSPPEKQQQQQSAVAPRTEVSSEPHPGMSEDHELVKEGQLSQAIRRPSPPPVDPR